MSENIKTLNLCTLYFHGTVFDTVVWIVGWSCNARLYGDTILYIDNGLIIGLHNNYQMVNQHLSKEIRFHFT